MYPKSGKMKRRKTYHLRPMVSNKFRQESKTNSYYKTVTQRLANLNSKRL